MKRDAIVQVVLALARAVAVLHVKGLALQHVVEDVKIVIVRVSQNNKRYQGL